MKFTGYYGFFFTLLFLVQGCERPVAESATNRPLNLPEIVDLMEYHSGQLVAQGSLGTKFSSDFGEVVYGDVTIQYSPRGAEAENNAYSLLLKIGDQEIELVLPNAAHRDFRDLQSK